MPITPKQLGQARPTNTDAVSIFSPAAGESVVGFVTVSNNGVVKADASIFVDNDGTTYDATTRVAFFKVQPKLKPFKIGPICMNNSNGNLAVKTSAASALTFTFNALVVT